MLAFAVIFGLIIVASAMDGVARQMRDANHLKRAELMAAGSKAVKEKPHGPGKHGH